MFDDRHYLTLISRISGLLSKVKSGRSYPQIMAFVFIAILLSSGNLSAVKKTSGLEIPKLKKGETIIRHTGFALVYSEPDEQPQWVAYTLTKKHVAMKVATRDTVKFKVDPLITTGSADAKDYKEPVYDQGHLCPANDNTWSVQAMYDCFYYSNMSPQTAAFNRGIWKDLEASVHNLANEYDTLYIVTGPVLKTKVKFKTIGANQVSVPDYFYKVVMVYGKAPQAIGYLIPHTGFTGEYSDYACSVDYVEKMTGIDFFYNLKDKIETSIEKTANLTGINKK